MAHCNCESKNVTQCIKAFRCEKIGFPPVDRQTSPKLSPDMSVQTHHIRPRTDASREHPKSTREVYQCAPRQNPDETHGREDIITTFTKEKSHKETKAGRRSNTPREEKTPGMQPRKTVFTDVKGGTDRAHDRCSRSRGSFFVFPMSGHLTYISPQNLYYVQQRSMPVTSFERTISSCSRSLTVQFWYKEYPFAVVFHTIP